MVNVVRWGGALRGQHIAVATLVLPVLALLGWWAGGVIVDDKPKPARAGQAYPLLEKSGCRYAGGLCELQNVDFKLLLSYREDAVGSYLVVHASHPLHGLLMAIGLDNAMATPMRLRQVGAVGTHWELLLQRRPQPNARIRVAVQAAASVWFADVSTQFLQLEVSALSGQGG